MCKLVLTLSIGLLTTLSCIAQFEVSPSLMMDDDFEPSFSVGLSQYFFEHIEVTYVETGFIRNDAFISAGLGYRVGETYAFVPSAQAMFISTEGLDVKVSAEVRSYRFGVGFGLGYTRIISLEKNLYGFSLLFPF